MTNDQRTILEFLERGWRLRHHRTRWLLKEPDFVSSFQDCPGGQSTIAELRDLRYIDQRNNITEDGRVALVALSIGGKST